MKAEIARAKAKEIKKTNDLREIQSLLDDIDCEASHGRFTICFHIRDDKLDDTIAKLQELGYKITSKYHYPHEGETYIRVEWY